MGTQKGQTPLHLAALYHQSTAVVWLVSKGGADVLNGDKSGRTSLELAQKDVCLRQGGGGSLGWWGGFFVV